MALLVLRRVGLCVGQNQMCHLRIAFLYFLGIRDSLRLIVRWQKLLTSHSFSMVFVNALHFNFFVRWGVLFFLGSACVSPSWSAGFCRDTAKLSAELRSSRKSGQDDKGRWFNYPVDGSCVVC